MANATRTRPSRARRGLLLAAIALLAYTVLSMFVGGATSPDEASQRQSSSFAVDDTGTRAYADLLEHYGIRVERQVGALESAAFPTQATIMLLDAESLSELEATRLRDEVAAGARIVVGGSDPPFLGRLIDEPPQWTRSFHDVWTIDNPGRFGAVHRIESGGEGAWSDPGATTVVAGTSDESLVTERGVGRGTIVFLADTTVLINKLIGQADNAAFAIALAGPLPHVVVFAEGVHGYSGATGWGAIPTRWRVALLLLVGAFGLLAWSRAVRLGPPESAERDLPPPRAEYLEAIGATLTRVDDTEAARAQLATAARAALARRGVDVGEDGIGGSDTANVAALTGVPAGDIVALFTPAAPGTTIGADTLVRAARAASAVQRATAPIRETTGVSP